MEVFNQFFNKESTFLIKYLENKHGNIEKFDQAILNINGFNNDVHEFMSSTLFGVTSSYVKVIRKNKNSYVLKLTPEGYDIARHLRYDSQIIRKNFFIKIFLFFANLVRWLIIKPISFVPVLFKLIFSNKTAKFILYILALAGGIVAILQLYKFYKTGQI